MEQKTDNYKKLTMKDDIMFKYFFSKKGNEKFLQSFLNAILGEEYKIKKIIHDSHLEQISREDKYGVLDLDVELESGEIINVEMQMKNLYNIEKRVTFHAAKKVIEQLVPGDNHNKLNKVIVIAILNYSFIKLPEYLTRTERAVTGHSEYKINNDVEYIYIELDKFRKQQEMNMDEEINQWVSFIDMERGDRLDMAVKKNKEVKEAKRRYDNLTDKEMKRLEEIRLFNSLEHGDALILERKEGEKIGIARGERAANIKTARKLLQRGTPVKDIVELTDLTLNEVEELKKDVMDL